MPAIATFLRLRPMNKIEAAQGGLDGVEAVVVGDDGISIKTLMNMEDILKEKKSKSKNKAKLEPNYKRFNFDVVFPTDTQQPKMFELMGQGIVDNVLDGYNSTLFAYGQTGAGKTFSLVGKLDNPDLFGIIPRAAMYLFRNLDERLESGELKSFEVSMNACEIYLNKILDIIKKTDKELKVRTRKDKSTYVDGIYGVFVHSMENVFEQMAIAFKNRKVTATGMNAESSRSHCVFCLNVKQVTTDGQVKASRMYLIDLAGSERVEKTGATGIVFEEAKAINSSLSALGNCINALSEQMGADPKKKQKHIPFRDNTLTHMLQDSLAGNCKTNLLVCATMHPWNLEETVSTMRFAERAKSIKTAASMGVELSPKQMKKAIVKMKGYLTEVAKICNYIEKKETDADMKKIATGVKKPVKKLFGKDYPKDVATPAGGEEQEEKKKEGDEEEDSEPDLGVEANEENDQEAANSELMAELKKKLAIEKGKSDMLTKNIEKYKAELANKMVDVNNYRENAAPTEAPVAHGENKSLQGACVNTKQGRGVVQEVKADVLVVVLDAIEIDLKFSDVTKLSGPKKTVPKAKDFVKSSAGNGRVQGVNGPKAMVKMENGEQKVLELSELECRDLNRATVKTAQGIGSVTNFKGDMVHVKLDGALLECQVGDVEEIEEDVSGIDVSILKRNIRVYKSALEKTREEWKKNQTKAVEKINHCRRVIGKYKEDKDLLLNITHDLESKMEEINNALKEEEKGAVMGSMTQKQGDALAQFLKK